MPQRGLMNSDLQVFIDGACARRDRVGIRRMETVFGRNWNVRILSLQMSTGGSERSPAFPLMRVLMLSQYRKIDIKTEEGH